MLSSHKGHVSYAEYQEPVGFIWKQAVTFCLAFVEAVGEFGLELEVVRSLFFLHKAWDQSVRYAEAVLVVWGLSRLCRNCQLPLPKDANT